MTSARVNTCRKESTGRSGDLSCAAPLIRQGFRRIKPSSTAVFIMALSSRYALAVVATLTPALRSVPHYVEDGRRPGRVDSISRDQTASGDHSPRVWRLRVRQGRVVTPSILARGTAEPIGARCLPD